MSVKLQGNRTLKARWLLRLGPHAMPKTLKITLRRGVPLHLSHPDCGTLRWQEYRPLPGT